MAADFHDVVLAPADLAESVALAHAVGWTDSAADWRVLHACARVLGVRDDGGALVAQVALGRFGALACVGKLIVRPDRQRCGLGQRLLRRVLALAHDAGARAVALVATDEGRPLYQAHGFVDTGSVSVCMRTAAPWPLAPSTPSARPLVAADLPAVLAFDREVMGCDRAALLHARLAERDAAFVVDAAAGAPGLAGFTIGLPQHAVRQVGPLLARDRDTAAALVRAVAAGAATVRLDVPVAHRAFAAALGFVEHACRSEMTLGGRPLPWHARPERFGLAAQAYG
jgi:GNAT superfamily N-acetyltransferase